MVQIDTDALGKDIAHNLLTHSKLGLVTTNVGVGIGNQIIPIFNDIGTAVKQVSNDGLMV